MNREIKFKGWDGKKMTREYTLYEMLSLQLPNNGLKHNWLQYIGLKDKNGKDIFEGNIARIEDYYENVRIGIIAFDSGTYKLQNTRQSFYYEFGSDGEYDWESIENVDEDNIEILGNIYENPELLNIK